MKRSKRDITTRDPGFRGAVLTWLLGTLFGAALLAMLAWLGDLKSGVKIFVLMFAFHSGMLGYRYLRVWRK